MSNQQQSEKEVNRKAVIQERLRIAFQRNLTLKYENECRRSDTEPSLEGLLKYAIEHGVVRETDINRYMTIEMYPKALYETNGRRRAAVQWLEDIIPVSDRLMFGWINNLSGRYLHYRHGRKK